MKNKRDKLGRFIRTRFDDKCLDCGKKLGTNFYQSKRCRSCAVRKVMLNNPIPKHTTPHSKKSKEKISKNRIGKCKGNKNHRWKGGITPQNQKDYHSPEYKEWRKKVFEKDKYRCQLCKKVGGYLESHHIKPYAKYKELKYEIDNGITLCYECHKDIHFPLR